MVPDLNGAEVCCGHDQQMMGCCSPLLWRPDCTFTLSLWGRPHDFYLALRKYIKAISDCGGSSVFDHAAAAVLVEARLVFAGILLLAPSANRRNLWGRAADWFRLQASPLLKAVRTLPGKPNITAKTKHDSGRRRLRRGARKGILILSTSEQKSPPECPENTQELSSRLCLSQVHMSWWTCETWGDRWGRHKGIWTCKMSRLFSFFFFWQGSRPWFVSIHIICFNVEGLFVGCSQKLSDIYSDLSVIIWLIFCNISGWNN